MRMKNHFPVKGQALNFVLIQRPGKIGNSLFRSRFFQYHNACFCPSNFAYELFSISLEAIVSPKRNWKQCLCTILEGQQRVLWYFETGLFKGKGKGRGEGGGGGGWEGTCDDAFKLHIVILFTKLIHFILCSQDIHRCDRRTIITLLS